MKNRREFLALFRGAVLGGAAAIVGFRATDAHVPEPVTVPKDRLPMVTQGRSWVSFTSSSGETTRITNKTYEREPRFIDGYIKGKYDASWPETA